MSVTVTIPASAKVIRERITNNVLYRLANLRELREETEAAFNKRQFHNEVDKILAHGDALRETDNAIRDYEAILMAILHELPFALSEDELALLMEPKA